MTSHLPGYDPGPSRRAGLAVIRQDIHVHAAAATIRALLADPAAYTEWLPPPVQDWQADSEGMTFTLALPVRRESIALRRDPSGDPREVVYRAEGASPAFTLAWGLHPEGAREAHVTVEIAYRPATGLIGGAMETLMHRPQRTQFLRDLLWNLKRAIERDRSGDAA